MMSRRTPLEWVARQLHGVGSLASASFIVVAVMVFALYSLASPGGQEPAGSGLPRGASRRVELTGEALQAGVPSLYIKAMTDRPIVLTAEIETHGWKNRGQRVIDADISRVEPIDPQTRVRSRAVAYPEGQITEQLSGQRVLASVSVAAAERLPERGEAKVALVVTPMGETATLVIDEVIAPVGENDSAGSPAASGESAGTVITATTGASVGAAAASTRVVALSRYWGAPGTIVTMTGTGFGRTAGTSWVTCAGARAKVVSWSASRIVFKIPSAMTKQGYIGVVKSKRPSNGLYFSPFSPPMITSISPREGAPGTTVTLKGRSFGAKQADGWVTFAGSTAQVVSWSNTSIRVVVPRDATSGYAGVVAHGMTSNGVLYGPLGAPLVTSVSARVLLPDRTVTVRGRGFGVRRGTVVVGGMRVAPDSWSPTEVRFTVSRNLTGGYVGVVRGDTWTSNGVWVPWAPRLVSVSSWWTRPLGDLTLTGVGFGASQGDRRVYIGGAEMTVVSWSDDVITVEVPADAVSGYVGVGTRSACSNGIYALVETPAHIASVSPHNGVAEGEALTISGSDFGGQRPTSRVLIGGALDCPVVSWSETQIVVTAPRFTETSYLGVVKHGVSSNGVWLTPRPGN